MNVSAIINYQVVDAIAATYNVEDKETFIQNQGLEVLRRVCAQFPYKCQYGTDEPSLMADGKLIGQCMRTLVQERCSVAGVQILKMDLMEVSYHVEVAQSLLQTQQAQAKIDARKLIVEGSVMIVHDALKKLDE